jgi:hypothetical protein
MNIQSLLAVTATFALLTVGCAHYNQTTLVTLAEQNEGATEITIDMCRDFGEAAQAAVSGEDRAYPILGKADEMERLSVGLSKHSIQCYSAMDRLSRELNPMTPFHHGALLENFKRAWRNARSLAE